MSTIGGWIAEGGMLAVIGICAIGIGVMLWGIYKVTDPNAGYEASRRRPKTPEPWDVEPTESTEYRPRHDGDQTRRLFAPKPRSGYAGEPTQVDRSESPTRVRALEEEGHEQEEGGTYRERWEDEGRAIEDGKEGSEDAEGSRPVTLKGWFYSPPMDAYYLIDSNGAIVRSVEAVEWEERRGFVAKDLLVQGFPMIPEHVPYHGREVSQ